MGHDGRIDSVASDTGVGRSVSTLGSLVPQTLVRRALSLRLEAPNTIAVGRRTSFRLHVRNRLPVGVSITLPTSRSWGWEVDEIAEGGIGRYSPPETNTELVFGPRERRTFTGYWDGQICESTGGQERWLPAFGTHELVAYVAVEEWHERGCYDAANVTVVDPDSG